MSSVLSINTLSFPGLGIGEFNVNEIAFSIGSLNVRWYGIIITIGMIVAFLISLHFAKKMKIKTDDMLDLAIFIFIFSIIGARVYNVIFTIDEYDSLLDMISIWKGGLAIYGGVIAGGITTVIVARAKKINVLDLLDIVTPGVIIAQAIGRWGNFINAEGYGAVTDCIFRMGIGSGNAAKFVHPIFLYESVWNLVGFGLLLLLWKFRKFKGEIVCTYFIWYGIGRFFIEGLRDATEGDVLYLGNSDLRVSQLVSVVAVVVGTVTFIILAVRKHKKLADETDYTSIYGDNTETKAENNFEVLEKDETVDGKANNSEVNTEEATQTVDEIKAESNTEKGENDDGKDN